MTAIFFAMFFVLTGIFIGLSIPLIKARFHPIHGMGFAFAAR